MVDGKTGVFVSERAGGAWTRLAVERDEVADADRVAGVAVACLAQVKRICQRSG